MGCGAAVRAVVPPSCYWGTEILERAPRARDSPSNRSNARTQNRSEVKPMGFITPNDFPNLRELYTAQLRYLLSTERQIVKGLPKMIEHSDDLQLRQVFQSHLQETETHVARLERLLTGFTNEVSDKKDSIHREIGDQGEEKIKEQPPGPVRDAGLIG